MANFPLNQVHGVFPAMLTLFDQREEVDLQRTRDLVDFLLERGVNGLYLTGSTGEGFLMDHAERQLVVETVIDRVAGRCPVIVHIGDIGTRKSIQLARHAEQAGADAVSSVPPFYWKFSQQDIYEYYRDLSEATNIPMIIYNIALAGLMDVDQILKIASLPNVKGIKFTGKDHDQMSFIKASMGEDFVLFSGCDEMALSGLAVGADAIIGTFYNLMPELYLKLFAAVRRGDLFTARRLMQIASEIILECVKYDFISAMRNMMRWRGVDAGYSRRPFHTYQDSELAPLADRLRAIRDKYCVTNEEVPFFEGMK